MLPLLLRAATPKSPVVLIPGVMGSRLFGSVSREPVNVLCPKTVNDSVIWMNKQYLMPPIVNCLIDWLTVDYDAESNLPVSRKGVNVSSKWGNNGLDGISFMDEERLGYKLLPYYQDYIESLVNAGYSENGSIFGAPFDWRFGLAGLGSFWASLKSLIEKAVKMNDGEPATIVGHSLGGYVLQKFLTRHSQHDWRRRFVKQAIFVAPSWGGSGLANSIIWRKRLPFAKYAVSKELRALIESLGALHVHLFNANVFGNASLVIGPENRTFTAEEIPELIIQQEKVPEKYKNLFMLNARHSKEDLSAPDVPSAIFYNSGLKTIKELVITDWNKEGKIKYGRGDFAVNAEGPEYACNHWGSVAKVQCHDFNKSDIRFNHHSMLMTQACVDIIVETIKTGNVVV